MHPIPARHHVSPAIFHEIRAAAEPVVLKGVVADWPIVRTDDPSGWLRGLATAKPVQFMRAPPEVGGRLHYADGATGRNFERGEATLAGFLDLLAAGQAEALALQGLPAATHLPGFAERNPMPLLPPAIGPRLWIGNAAKVATHHDPSENIACVAAGRRRFTLFPPEQVGNLYMGPFDPTPAGVQVSMVHVTAPDLARYPRFAEALAAALVAELEPGDALYIPYQWYHHVEALDAFNVLVNYWWDPARADIGSPLDAMMAGMMSLRPLPPDQRRAWRAMFDHYVFLTKGDPGAHLAEGARGILGATSPRDIAQMRRALLARLQA
ncbi:cupin-like domain-containing protein [Sphingomonas psychrotolerans]|uniref:Cupin-like domain-containing protein n=1 Tax=Sphingomonas psychrotolerans TaxID=1327635 RepID=A0A2K8MMY2_9SPHN|nr:cupin-like domain-containing protein [Sphingomonas psychrotolerans]ATY34036.1 cupin-like domain-containing protein [Sphingomonas psychrotolerans]